MNIFEEIEKLKLVPVAIIENSKDAVPLGQALVKAELPLIEVTFRTDAAEMSIQNLTREMPNLLVGAGTVLKIDHIKKAVKAGAKFMVTPGFNPVIVDFCVKKKIPIIPGLNTPSMIEWGLDRGLNAFKFFPADLSGGTKMLELLMGPYPEAKFMPTGGINYDTLIKYLKLKNVMACGGSWIVKKELISSGKFEEITKLTKDAVSLIKSEFK
jgi:2-dehydro-3-deoxyphosphogluconate aldolase/(4S)-4-hydroxy-2-oxoglutarate aldolase